MLLEMKQAFTIKFKKRGREIGRKYFEIQGEKKIGKMI